MIRRKPRSELVVAAQPGGVAVQGPRALTDGFTDRLMAVVLSPEFAHAGVAVGAVRSVLDRATDSGSVLFEFSPRAMALLEQHGAIPTGEGFFRSMVHDGEQFAGNLDWRPITPGPELLQLKTMAVGLALQASLEELAAAVERVEDKIDHLTDRIRSFQVGEVIAHPGAQRDGCLRRRRASDRRHGLVEHRAPPHRDRRQRRWRSRSAALADRSR